MLRITFPLILTSVMFFGVPGTSQLPDSSSSEERTVVESVTGAEVRISGEGDCSTLNVEVHMPVSLHCEGAVGYDSSDTCTSTW